MKRPVQRPSDYGWKYKHEGLEGRWSQDASDYCLTHEEINYGLPCVIGWIYEVGEYATNCIFCGRRFEVTAISGELDCRKNRNQKP